MSLLEYCLFHSSMGIAEGPRAAMGCLGAFSLGVSSSSSSAGSSFFGFSALGAACLGASFFGAASFLGASLGENDVEIRVYWMRFSMNLGDPMTSRYGLKLRIKVQYLTTLGYAFRYSASNN